MQTAGHIRENAISHLHSVKNRLSNQGTRNGGNLEKVPVQREWASGPSPPGHVCVVVCSQVTKVTSFSNTSLSSLIWPFYKNKIEKAVTFVTFPIGFMSL